VHLSQKRRQKLSENYKLKILFFTKLHCDEKVRKFDMDIACNKHGRKKKLLKILVRKTEAKRRHRRPERRWMAE
jgi:hypothetical protein